MRRLLAALSALLVAAPAAAADLRPATPSESWPFTDAAELLRSKGVAVPPFAVMVARGEITPWAYASPGVVVVSRDAAADARLVLASARRPTRFRRTAIANAPVYTVAMTGLHEVTHIAQYGYGTVGSPACDTTEGVADAVAYDWSETLVRRRWGPVPVSRVYVYANDLKRVLAATGEKIGEPTAYAGRAARLRLVRGEEACPHG